ncbi:MAG: hypothetical protein JXM70_13615 [Pirellulales bacterium]|nr:hypothetical protein [Pirellulales bacterium]
MKKTWKPGRFIAIIVVTGLTAFCPLVALGQSAWYEGHESNETSWREAGGNAHYQVQQHNRTGDQSHTGNGCEHILVDGQDGTYVYFSHAVDCPLVIPELLPSVWIKSDRAGLQIMARVVLPRTEDPRTGSPITTLVRGTSYSQVGRWQQLHITQIPLLLNRSIRVLRMQMGPNVDGREAFIDRILLNVYGGPGKTNIWIDDLDIAGHVKRPIIALDAAVSTQPITQPPQPLVRAGVAGPTLRNAAPTGGISSHPQTFVPMTGAAEQQVNTVPAQPDAHSLSYDVAGGARQGDNRVELVGSVLQVDGHPVFPLAIQYRGESLSGIKDMGFNTVWLDRPADGKFLAEADRLGLWVVCPPPYLPEKDDRNDRTAPSKRIGPEYRPVLAWDLGEGESEEDLQKTRSWAQQIKAADLPHRRPLICRPETGLRGFSRFVDLLMVSHSPLATSLELNDYGTWLRQRPRLARPGTIVWSSVQTQPALALENQWAMLGREHSLPPLISSEQIRLMAYTAIAAGSRGLLFNSRSSLDATDAATRARATALELLNLELNLIRPWVSAGRVASTISSNQPEVSGAVLHLQRSRLLLPIWTGRGAQFVPGQSATKTISFKVRHVPDSHRAYEISPGGIRPVRNQRRVTGGMQVTLDEFSLSRPILLTEDQQVTAALTRRAREPHLAERCAELYRRLAVRKLQVYEDVDRRMSAYPEVWQTNNNLQLARKHLETCDAMIARGDHQTACIEAQRSMRILRILERENWLKATEGLKTPVASPATTCFSTIPWHWDLTRRTRGWQLGMNRLPVGDFEDVSSMVAAGWRHMQHKSPGVTAQAEVVPQAAHSGRGGLRLMAIAEDSEQPLALVESPPIWLSSPPLNVEAGTLIRIQGWVQVPSAITGSVDGLLIFDSLSGESMAERIGETTGWQPFTLYRVVTQSGSMTVTFALSGMGEAWLDDISVQSLGPNSEMLSRQTLPANSTMKPVN